MLKSSAPPSPTTSPERPIQNWISQNHWLVLSGTCVAFLLIAVWGAVGLFSAGKLPEDEARSQNIAPSPTVVEPVEPNDSPFSLGNLLSLLVVCGLGSGAVIWMLQRAIATPTAPRRRKKRPNPPPRQHRRPQPQPRTVAAPPQRRPPQPQTAASRPNPALSYSVNRTAPAKSRRRVETPVMMKRSLPPAAPKPQLEEAVAIVPAETAIPLDNRPVGLADRLDIRKRHSLSTLMREPQSLKAPPRKIQSW